VITQAQIIAWIQKSAEVITENRAYLTDLDAAIGDADHGANMDRGFKAVLGKIAEMEGKDIGTVLKTTAMTLISTVGGASGPLYGTFFLQTAAKAMGKTELTLQDWHAALQAGLDGIISRGKAQTGDKTMIDALAPAVQSLLLSIDQNQPIPEALRSSAEAARIGMQATIPLVARKGRASYLGERSAGHQDPGATSMYLLLDAASQCLGQ
jgi:dihydroxyacetone kinase-like protein